VALDRQSSTLDMRGVTLFGIKGGLITSGRLYMEEVEELGTDIDATVRRLSGRPSRKG
jgi:hypothetical protein